MRFSKPLCVVLAMCVTAVSGCGGEGVDGPSGTVTGKVTSKAGTIPEGTTIVFTPDKGNGIPAGATIASDGTFKLRRKDSFELPIGIYKVSISPPEPKQMSDEEAMRASIKGKVMNPEHKSIPKKYRDPATSGETFEVKKGENEYNLEMKPK